MSTVPVDTPVESFGPFASFVEIWRRKWHGDSPPVWSDFDFLDFRGWHGWIHVDELISEQPFDMRCRLWGTRLVEFLGYDETGRHLSESPAASEAGLVNLYRRVLDGPRIGLNVGTVTSYNRSTVFSVVKLPCAASGRHAGVILSVSLPDVTLELDGQEVVD